jgi:hypothetical protein
MTVLHRFQFAAGVTGDTVRQNVRMDDRSRRASPSARRGRLLAEARAEAAGRRPADLLAQWSADATVRPSPIDLRLSVALDALALDSAPDYEGVLLSPVAPIGSTSVLAPTSQDRTLSTIRPTEVVSDPTNVLALECAARLRRDPRTHVRLCTVHQLLRMQPTGGAAHTKHFRLFSLVDAGPGSANDGFEVQAVVAQLAVYRRVLEAAASVHRLSWERPLVTVRADDSHAVLGDRVAEAVAGAQPDAETRREVLMSSYYHGLRVGFGAHDGDGVYREVADLGIFDWVARLTSNRRHRFVASGLGIQLLPILFAAH